MLTFMLACVKCTSHVTSLGWGGGDVNVHVNLRLSKSAIVPRPDPTAMLTQSWCEASGCGSGVGWTPRPKVWWRSQVKPWRIVWQCEWKKNRASFQAQFPVNYKSSLKNHFKIPGIFKTILGNESAVSLWRKRHFFFFTLKTLARFSPRRDVCVFVCKHFCRRTFLSETLVHEHVASCFVCTSSLSASSILLVRFLSQLFFKCKDMAYLTSLWKDNLMLVSCFSLVPRYHLVWAFEEHCVLFHCI